MKVKTADLVGPAIDWAVAQCESVEVEYINDGITRCLLRVSPFTGMYRPSVDWSQGGPIIERERITINQGRDLIASIWHPSSDLKGNWYRFKQTGPTPLIAAVRCFVASRLGDEVDIPEELL